MKANISFLNFSLSITLLSLLTACAVEEEFTEDIEDESSQMTGSQTTIVDSDDIGSDQELMITWSASNISTDDSGWANHDIPGKPIEGATFVGCRGCEPYRGDTSKSSNLRLLCFVPASIPEPSGYAATQQARWEARSERPAINDWRYYYDWSHGYVGLTRPIEVLKEEGIVENIPLGSAQEGDRACQNELSDSQAKLLEFHDSGGAWNLAGMIHPNSAAPDLLGINAGEERFIIYIDDQQSNPWD
jgi:hypothetical protein